MQTVLAFAVAALGTGLITPLIRRAAHGRGLLDEPGPRKVHETPVPRLGGVAMVAGFVAALAVVALLESARALPTMTRGHTLPILVGLGLVTGVGVIDDLRGSRAVVKLAAQVLAAGMAWALGLSIESLVGPWGTLSLGWLSLPVTVAWIVGIINAINLVDGVDGLASGVVLAALSAFGVLAAVAGLGASLIIVAAAAGAVLGFLRYNLYPATIIMGDTGSMFLGFVAAAVSISLTQAPPSAAVAPWIPIVALGVPIADTAWAIVRRAGRGEHPFTADRGHIHHRLLATGMTPLTVMLALTAVSAALAATAVGLAVATR